MIVILLVVLILLCGVGGYHLGPGPGYYPGGLGLILLILLILLVLGYIPGGRF